MASYNLSINNKNYQVEADPAMPLLWVIRYLAGLTGTKFGCGIAQCGAGANECDFQYDRKADQGIAV